MIRVHGFQPIQFVSCSQMFLNCYLLSLLCVHNILFRTLHYEISHISHVEDSNEFTKKCNAYTTCTSPIMHLICPPKFCISIVFNFCWDSCNIQEKWKTKVMQNFGRQIRCIMGDVQVAYVQSCYFVYQTFWSCHCHCHCHYHCIRSLIVPSNNKCFFFSKLKSAPRQLK